MHLRRLGDNVKKAGERGKSLLPTQCPHQEKGQTRGRGVLCVEEKGEKINGFSLALRRSSIGHTVKIEKRRRSTRVEKPEKKTPHCANFGRAS